MYVKTYPLPAHKKGEARDCFAEQPRQLHRKVNGVLQYNEEGSPVVVKYPRTAHEWWITPSGNQVALVLSGGGALSEDDDPSRAAFARNKAIANRWFALGSCPLSYADLRRELPKAMARDTICPPESCSNKNPCVHANALIEARRKKQAELMKKFENQAKTLTDRHLEAVEQSNDQMRKLIEYTVGKRGRGESPASIPGAKVID